MTSSSSHSREHLAWFSPSRRPRRLRRSAALRNLVAESSVQTSQLVYPLFVKEGLTQPVEIPTMPGIFQHTIDSLQTEVNRAKALGVTSYMLFGIPLDKDEMGSGAVASDNILNQALWVLRDEHGDSIVLMADTCLDEFTSHGHCGVLDQDGEVDNDATNHIYARMAIEQAKAGADVVSPSGMMDGQVAVIRAGLDEAGYQHTSILAYSAKYVSAFYGPFRDAVDSSLVGNRSGYQMDSRNRREALVEVALDSEEGADMVMVKPAMPYLDIVRDVSENSVVPVAAYQVSGEYAMMCAAAKSGMLDREAIMMESLSSISRAGADIILTYFAPEAAALLRKDYAS